MPSYMQNNRGTIRKIRGAEPLPNLSIEEQKANELKRHGFIALRIGFSRRQHAERLVRETNELLERQKLLAAQPVNEVDVVRQMVHGDALAPKEDLAS